MSTGHEIPPALLPDQGAAAHHPHAPPAPEPSHAERARTVLGDGGRATLSTVGRGGEAGGHGYPFGSVVNVAVDERGRPFTFLSAMAEHTANLDADARASLLLVEQVPSGADTLASGRVTLVGDLRRVPEPGPLREAFLAVHPSSFYVDYGDFRCYRMEVTAVRYVGGFGRMSWVDPDGYAAAAPDPLRAAAAGAIGHMNADHGDALVAMARALAGQADATAAAMSALDRYGFDLVVEAPAGQRVVRVGFDAPLDSAEPLRATMRELTARARAGDG